MCGIISVIISHLWQCLIHFFLSAVLSVDLLIGIIARELHDQDSLYKTPESTYVQD